MKSISKQKCIESLNTTIPTNGTGLADLRAISRSVSSPALHWP